MSENDTITGGGEATAPVAEAQAPIQVVPKNDVEAAAIEAAKPTQPEAPNAADEAEKNKAKNRTKQYIDRINGENAELRRQQAEYQKRMDALESRLPAKPQDREPTLEDFNYNPDEYRAAIEQRASERALKTWEQQQEQKAATQKQQETAQAYVDRANAFAADHEDFEVVVGSIPPQLLPDALQAAIMAHAKGPEIAYRLATNEDELWTLASLRPELLSQAVDRIASRLGAAPPPAPEPPVPPAIAPPTNPKPVSQAPAPAPRISGRSPSEIPPEKLTDDEWYKRDAESRRKR
jgi:hypothetical protein